MVAAVKGEDTSESKFTRALATLQALSRKEGIAMAIVGGLAAIHQFCRVGRYAFVGGLAAVVKDVIPYGSVWGNHAHLEGLNLVGLKRRGFGRETINTLRAAYRLLFADEGTFQERLADAEETYGASPEVMEILNFIRADANRPICLPQREV